MRSQLIPETCGCIRCRMQQPLSSSLSHYDTHIKAAKQFEYVTYYIEQNPVVKGLVDTAEQWDASSASCKDVITDPWPLLSD